LTHRRVKDLVDELRLVRVSQSRRPDQQIDLRSLERIVTGGEEGRELGAEVEEALGGGLPGTDDGEA
jgi:hypothetical protein